jgi:hypothetical protein
MTNDNNLIYNLLQISLFVIQTHFWAQNENNRLFTSTDIPRKAENSDIKRSDRITRYYTCSRFYCDIFGNGLDTFIFVYDNVQSDRWL